MDEEDEKADELSRLEAKRASDVNDEIAYNHMLETVDNDAKPQFDVEHILDSYNWGDLDNKNYVDDDPPHFSYTNYTRKHPNYVIKFDHDVSEYDNDGDVDDVTINGNSDSISGKRLAGFFYNEHVHHTNRMSIPEPPQELYALGSNEAAYIWWDLEIDEEIEDTILEEGNINSATDDAMVDTIRRCSTNNDRTNSMKFPDPIVYEAPSDDESEATASTITTNSAKPNTAYSVSRINYYKKVLKQISDPGYLHVPMNNHMKNNIDIDHMHATIDINDENNFKYDDTKTEGKGARGHITSYEIKRYRLEKTGLWTLKGSTVISEEHEVMARKYRIDNLQNDYFYRFSIVPSNKRHKGNESPLSNIVKVEAPLPIHWYKVYPTTKTSGGNTNTNLQFYYKHMKSGKIMYRRPDQDPKFVDETVRRLFSEAEINYCAALFDEEIAINERVTAEGMRSCLLAMGEFVRLKTIMKYFVHFSIDTESRFIFSFQEFMYIVYGVKKSRIDRDSSIANVACCYSILGTLTAALRDSYYCNCCRWNPYWQPLPKPQCQHYYAQQEESNRLGLTKSVNDWEQIYCEVLDTYIYRNFGSVHVNTEASTSSKSRGSNSSNGVFRWDAPVEVRYFMSLRLEGLLFDEFTPKEVDEFKIIFNLFDADSSGFIGEEELKFWLQALGIPAPKRKVIEMIKDVDLNMNGVIEFEEFCWMYYRIHRHPNQVSKEWHKLASLAKDIDRMVTLGETFIRTFHKPIDSSYLDVNLYRRRSRLCGSATITDNRSGSTNKSNSPSPITNNEDNNNEQAKGSSTSIELLAPKESRLFCALMCSHCCCTPITIVYTAAKSSLQCLHWSWFAGECDSGVVGECCTAFFCPFKTLPHGPYCVCGCRFIEDTGDAYYTDNGDYLSAFFDLFY